MRFKLFCLMAATTWQLAACATEPQTRIAPGEAEPDVATPAIVSEPSFDEVFNLVIETERHSVMIGNAMHGVSVNMMDDRLDDGAEIYRVDHALRSGVRDLIALRDCGAALNGAISGRALYDGALDLGQALEALNA